MPHGPLEIIWHSENTKRNGSNSIRTSLILDKSIVTLPNVIYFSIKSLYKWAPVIICVMYLCLLESSTTLKVMNAFVQYYLEV